MKAALMGRHMGDGGCPDASRQGKRVRQEGGSGVFERGADEAQAAVFECLARNFMFQEGVVT